MCSHSQNSLPNKADTKNFSLKMALPSKLAKNGLTWIEILVIVFIILVIIALLLPNVDSPLPSPRFLCLSNQRYITQALLDYESEKGSFPPAYIADKDGKPMHSWRVLILPYLGRKDIYDCYDFNEPWNGPHNLLLANRMIDIFRCPNNRNTPNCTSYVMLVGPHAFSPGSKGRSLKEISEKDGTSTTIMLAEVADAKIPWNEPRDLNVEEMTFQINKNKKELSSRHSGLVIVSFCDGHCLTIAEDIKPETLKALTTVDGSEPINEGEY